MNGAENMVKILAPIVAARREAPQDDLISVLVEAEMTDEDGTTHRLSDAEIYSFAYLLLAAGSGTTWKQMGITLAALLTRPALLDAVRDDAALLKAAIEESMRWAPTDPMFSRFVRRDIDFHGVHLPEGAVCTSVSERPIGIRHAMTDPTSTTRADPPRRASAFGSGPHICLGHARGPRRDGHRHRGIARSAPEPAPRPRRRGSADHRDVRTRRHRTSRPLRLIPRAPKQETRDGRRSQVHTAGSFDLR